MPRNADHRALELLPRHLARRGRRWVKQETDKLRAVDGIADVRLRHVGSAALRHPRAWDWYLELQLGNGDSANAVVRRPEVDEFLADLRLLGTRPTVLAIPEDG